MSRRKSRSSSSGFGVKYFIFSTEYLVLAGLLYTAFLIGPYAAVKGSWQFSIAALVTLLICVGLLYLVLDGYFSSTNRPAGYAYRMTLLTIFPPVIGPIMVLLRTLD